LNERTLTLDCRHSERACLITDKNAQPDSMPSFVYEHWRRFAVIDGARRVNQCAFDHVVEPELDDDLPRVSAVVES
jgi:hypothetical protein